MNLPASRSYNLPLSLVKHVCVFCGRLVYCEENWPVKPPKLLEILRSITQWQIQKTVTCPDTFGLN